MDWSLPSTLVDWAQVISAVLSLLALVLALFAIWKSKRDIALERRINHELEVLRDTGLIVSTASQHPGSPLDDASESERACHL
jgi:hypothetical protein